MHVRRAKSNVLAVPSLRGQGLRGSFATRSLDDSRCFTSCLCIQTLGFLGVNIASAHVGIGADRLAFAKDSVIV